MIGRWLIVAMAWITSVGEQLRRRADADDAGRPQLLHRLDEGGHRRPILGERRLEGGARGKIRVAPARGRVVQRAKLRLA